MSMKRIGSMGFYWPEFFPVPPTAPGYGFNTGLTINATGMKIAWVGRVWFPARTGNKNIRRVHFRYGSITKAGGSALTLSLQNIQQTTNPGSPDGVKQQSVAIPNAQISTGATWFRSDPLNADRTVTFGEKLAVVVEFDAAGRLGSDSIMLSGVTGVASGTGLDSFSLVFTAAWSPPSTAFPIMVLEFSDGTYGSVAGALPWSNVGNASFSDASLVSDEYALAFTVPVGCLVDALAMNVRAVTATSDFDAVLYEGTAVLHAVRVVAGSLATNSNNLALLPIPEQRLYPGRQYYLAIKPVSGGTVSAYWFDVSDPAFFSLMHGDATCNFSTRLNEGEWAAPTLTRRLQAAVRISAIDVGGGQAMATII